MWEIKESAIANIKIGDTIDVIIPGDNNKVYKGKVTSISSKASYATERATQDKNEKDVVAFTVKIKFQIITLVILFHYESTCIKLIIFTLLFY